MGNYEQHYFADHNLPIIFHFDRVFKGREGLPHWHENIELLYCVSGAGEAMVESRPVPMRQGCLTVINSSRVHYTRLTEEPFGYYCLIVDSGFLEQMELYVEERELDEFVQSAEISARFERIIREMEEKRDYFEATVKGEVGALMAYLLRNHSRPGSSGGYSDMVKVALRYLKKHYPEPVGLDEVAEATGFSRYYFCRKFKSVTGYTVNGYLQFLRCREAERLLREERYSVSEAASACGFDDVSYFTKVFKKQTGFLPSQVKHKEGTGETGK